MNYIENNKKIIDIIAKDMYTLFESFKRNEDDLQKLKLVKPAMGYGWVLSIDDNAGKFLKGYIYLYIYNNGGFKYVNARLTTSGDAHSSELKIVDRLREYGFSLERFGKDEEELWSAGTLAIVSSEKFKQVVDSPEGLAEII